MDDKEVARILQNSLEVNQDLRRIIDVLSPKAEIWDKLTETNQGISMQEAADSLKYKGIGRNIMLSVLRDQGILQSKEPRKNVPYREYIERGYFVVRESSVPINGGYVLKPTTLVTPKGIGYIKKVLDKLGYGDKYADASR